MNPRVGTNPLLLRINVRDDQTGELDSRVASVANVTSVTVTEPDRVIVDILTYIVDVPSVVTFNHALTKPGVYTVEFGLLFNGVAAPSSRFRFTVDP